MRMKLNDFQISKCTYPVNVPFSITWSQDDIVALATENGVYVTELGPNFNLQTPNLYIRRHFVPCSTYLPTRHCGIDVEDLIKRLDKKGKYVLFQDITMAPVLSAKCPSVPVVKYVAWSPVVFRHRLRSLLTVITDSGSLTLYYLSQDTWFEGPDIAISWLDRCSSGWRSPSKDLMGELKSRSYKVKFSAFAWGTVLEKPWYDLFVSSYDGTISVWRIKQDEETRKIIVEFVKEFHCQRELITALCCQYIAPRKYIVFISYIDGRIGSVVVEYGVNDINISQENMLWCEKDRIAVRSGGLYSSTHTSTISESTAVLHVVKGSHILIFNINLNGELISHKVATTPELSITGLASLSETESIILGFSGTLYNLSLKSTEPAITKIQDSLRTKHYSCMGIALSRNKTIAVLPYSVITTYDHLVMKDLSLVLWCSFAEINDLNEKILSYQGPLYDIWDIIEITRIESILKTPTLVWDKTAEDLDNMEESDLRKSLAVLQVSSSLSNSKNGIMKNDKSNFIPEIMDLIMTKHVIKEISVLKENTNLSDFKKKSFFLMKQWLENVIKKYSAKFKTTAAIATNVKIQLDAKPMDVDKETCSICGNDVTPISDRRISTCQLGHTLPRCILSLVQCDDIPYYTCGLCNTVAHSKAVSDTNSTCIFCNGVLRIVAPTLTEEESVIINGKGQSMKSRITEKDQNT